jgi:hypothetical protein
MEEEAWVRIGVGAALAKHVPRAVEPGLVLSLNAGWRQTQVRIRRAPSVSDSSGSGGHGE